LRSWDYLCRINKTHHPLLSDGASESQGTGSSSPRTQMVNERDENAPGAFAVQETRGSPRH
jgi:hypothetical protein